MELNGNININNIHQESLRAQNMPEKKAAPSFSNEQKECKKAPNNPNYWQSLVFKGNQNKPVIDDELAQTIGLKKDRLERTLIEKCRFTFEDLSKLKTLLNEGKISPTSAKRLIDEGAKYYDEKTLKAVPSIISKLSEFAEADDKNSLKYFDILLNEKLFGTLNASEIEKYVFENSLAKGNIMEFMINSSKEDGTTRPLFSNPTFFDKELGNFITEENAESIKEFAKEVAIEKEMSPSESIRWAYVYTNPYTHAFDKELYNMEKELNSTYNKDFGGFSSEVKSFLPLLVNGKTKKIDNDLVDLLKEIYFEPRKAMFEYDGTPSTSRHSRKKIPCVIDSIAAKDMLEAAKDAQGVPNKKNIKLVKACCKNNDIFERDIESLPLFKNNEGIIDKKLYEQWIHLRKNGAFKPIGFAKANLEFGQKKAKEIKNKLQEMLGSESEAVNSMETYLDYCLDENGNENKENIEFLEKIVPYLNKTLGLSPELFKLPKTDEVINTIAQVSDNISGIGAYEDKPLFEFIKTYSDENGKIDPFAKEKLLKYCTKNCQPDCFTDIFSRCITDDNNFKNNFDENLFNQMTSIYDTKSNLSNLVFPLQLKEIIKDKNSEIPNSLSLKSKLALLNALNLALSKPEGIYDAELIKSIASSIESSISPDNILVPVDKENIVNFISSVGANKKTDKENFTQFEKTMINSIPLLKEMKDGIKISYSRDEFLNDLSKVCNSDEKIKTLSRKTGIEPICENGRITGYNGIITLDSLDCDDEFENKVYELCHKFLFENEAQSGNKDLDKEINTIIKAAPEFINTIGKKQHGTHGYSLDIHQLLVLANSINNPDYQKLNNVDKTMLKTACIFHDISKQENAVDKGHQNSSAIYAKNIVNKLYKNPETKDRIYDLIKNHHWLEEYSNSGMPEKFAFKFRRPNDFEIAKIMAKSDLMSVSDSFYLRLKDALDEYKLKPIEEKLTEMYSSGNAIFSDYPLSEAKLQNCKETLDGVDYKVINFHKISNSEDMENYGFEFGKRKKDLRFLVHMVPDESIKNSLNLVKMLSNTSNEGVLSESLISLDSNRTYCNRKYGLLLSQINTNIINTSKSNQGSGTEKKTDQAIELIFNTYPNSASKENRGYFKENLLKNLEIDENSVTSKDFADFYRENIANKRTISQIIPSKEYKLGKHLIKGEKLIAALKKYQDNDVLTNMSDFHNEIVGYAPKIKGVIAKENELKDVPKELLDFAQKNNLPIVLI